MNRLTVFYCIASLEWGGAEGQLCYLCEAMMQRGHSAHVAYVQDAFWNGQDGGLLDRISESGATLHQLTSNSNYDARMLWHLRKIMTQVKPQLLQTWLPQMDVIGALSAISTGIPFILTERSSGSIVPENWKSWLRISLAKRAAVIVCNSKGGAEYWKARTTVPVMVIRNGIPFKQIHATQRKVTQADKSGRSTEVMLFVGRYAPEKNVITLANVVMQILKQRANAVAVFIGDGPLREQLIQLQQSSGFGERWIVLGFEKSNECWAWMKRANVFISISMCEGQPGTVLEAVAANCPMVVSDIPAHREFLNESFAWFVSPSNPAKVAETITHVLSNQEFARMKASHASTLLSSLSIDAMAQNYLATYENILYQQRS